MVNTLCIVSRPRLTLWCLSPLRVTLALSLSPCSTLQVCRPRLPRATAPLRPPTPCRATACRATSRWPTASPPSASSHRSDPAGGVCVSQDESVCFTEREMKPEAPTPHVKPNCTELQGEHPGSRKQETGS